MDPFIQKIPKAELHIHIEGSLEPELMFRLAARNGLSLPFRSVREAREAYHFKDLQSFLDIYYQGARVLVREEDFYDLTSTYLRKAHSQGVRHAEMFVDPQTHTNRGVAFECVISGMQRAMEEAQRQLGLSSRLIICFLRHLSAEAAMTTLRQALPFKAHIAAVGLDSSELGYPPELFRKVFDKAREEGFLTVAHAGEEGPPQYIWQALDLLKVSRLDHGDRCVEDVKLIRRLAEDQTPLTVCPLSNVKLRVVSTMERHPLKQLLAHGLCATVNSDDPAYFGGYVAENLLAVQEALELDRNAIYQLAKNSFRAAFLDPPEKKKLIDDLDDYVANIDP